MKSKFFIGLIIIFALGSLYFFVSLGNDSDLPENILESEARVLSVDNSEIMTSNVSAIGYQSLRVEILEGIYKGEEVQADNSLNGQIEYDQVYEKGDKIIIGIKHQDNQIQQVRAIDYYRQSWIGIIFIIFVLALLIYARFIGFKAILSFAFSLLILWKFLLENLLLGKDPILLTSLTIMMLSGIIIFLVSGFNKRGLAAFLATTIGLLMTLVVTHFFGHQLSLSGLTQPYAQTLMISGYHYLNLQEIFYAAIILGASGAAMDIAVDISASMYEIKSKKPEIKIKELIESGFNVGRQVIGTMATTLLLAYSGSYLTLLMLFIARETSVTRMLNLKVVSAEIMRTLIGSIGLVIVAPTTALIAGVLFSYEFNLKEIIQKSKVAITSLF
jgi:uncharacterized membrane protein